MEVFMVAIKVLAPSSVDPTVSLVLTAVVAMRRPRTPMRRL